MSAAQKEEAKLHGEAISSISSVSTLLRQAIEAAMPVAPEQYMTIAVPGTVIDLEDYENGGEFVYDLSKHALPPTSVRQAEGRLVDSMMPIANIMVSISLSNILALLIANLLDWQHWQKRCPELLSSLGCPTACQGNNLQRQRRTKYWGKPL